MTIPKKKNDKTNIKNSDDNPSNGRQDGTEGSDLQDETVTREKK